MNPDKVQFVDLQAQYQGLKTDLDAAVARVLHRGDYILGEDVKLFEEEFAAFCRASHCVAVSDGS